VAEKPSRLGRAGAVLSLAILAAIAVVYSGPAARPKSALALEEASGTVTVWVGSWWQSQIPLVIQCHGPLGWRHLGARRGLPHQGQRQGRDQLAKERAGPDLLVGALYQVSRRPQGTPNFSTTRDLLPLFEANKLGMVLGSSNIIDEFSKHPELKWGAVLSPSKVNRFGGWTMGVPVGAKNSAVARVFLLWLAKPENMGKLMNRTPARLSVYNAPP